MNDPATNGGTMDFVTEQMEGALIRLQAVRSYDYAAAYEAAYSGISALDPRANDSAAELIYGRTLALRSWHGRMLATNALRAEAA